MQQDNKMTWIRTKDTLGAFILPLLLPLVIGVDSAALAQEPPALLREWYQLKNELRTSLAPAREPKYGLEFLRPRDAEDTKPFDFRSVSERVVLVLGGLQTSRDAAELFASHLRWRAPKQSGAMYAVFDYPNDGSIEESGRVLRDYLKTLQLRAPQSRVSIVAHSMGGLVARVALEMQDEKNTSPIANVDRIVMICPPNKGSILAQYADALELADLMNKAKERGFTLETIADALLHDGMGEACDDLVPGSKCLNKLNALPRAAGIKYSIAAGTGGPITPAQRLLATLAVEQMRANFKANSRELDWFVKKGEELLHCDELCKGRGDGAVSQKSTQLDGVDDKALFAMHHVQWVDASDAEVQRMHHWVSERVH